MALELKRTLVRFAFPVAAALFGVMTLFEGGSLIRSLSLEEMVRQRIVPAILFFNAGSGLAYLAIAAVAFTARGRSSIPAAGLTALILCASLFLGVHVVTGGPYLGRTVIAMTFRFLFWVAFTAWAWRGRQQSESAPTAGG